LDCSVTYEQEEEKKREEKKRSRRRYYQCTNYATLQAITGNVLKSPLYWDITQL